MIELLNWFAASPVATIIFLLFASGCAAWSIEFAKAIRGKE